MGTSITFLGTGHGNVSADRFQASILLRSGASRFLLDAGEPCAQRMRELGERPGDLEAVLLTHGHADHVGGLPLLLQAAWGDGRETPLPVAMPGSLAGPLAAWCEFILSLLPKQADFGIEISSWCDGVAQDFGPLTVIPRPTNHLSPSGTSVSLDLQIAGKRILYSGDIGSSSDLEPHLAEPADILICELAHITPEALATTLQPATLGMLVLTHIAETYLEQREEICDILESQLGGTDIVYLAEDDLVLDL